MLGGPELQAEGESVFDSGSKQHPVWILLWTMAVSESFP